MKYAKITAVVLTIPAVLAFYLGLAHAYVVSVAIEVIRSLFTVPH